MRIVSAALIFLISSAALADDAPAKRFGVEPDLKTFPQATPKETLASVLKAIEGKRADYIVAHLADPEFVDRRVKETGHDELLSETTAKPSTFERSNDGTSTGETTSAARTRPSAVSSATLSMPRGAASIAARKRRFAS